MSILSFSLGMPPLTITASSTEPWGSPVLGLREPACPPCAQHSLFTPGKVLPCSPDKNQIREQCFKCPILLLQHRSFFKERPSSGGSPAWPSLAAFTVSASAPLDVIKSLPLFFALRHTLKITSPRRPLQASFFWG